MARRFQFSLKWFFVSMSLVALWVGHAANLVRERRAWLREFRGRLSLVDDIGADTEPEELPWIRRLLGDEPIPALYDDLAEPDREYVQQLRQLFPEAKIRVRGKEYPPDSSLRRPLATPPHPVPGFCTQAELVQILGDQRRIVLSEQRQSDFDDE